MIRKKGTKEDASGRFIPSVGNLSSLLSPFMSLPVSTRLSRSSLSSRPVNTVSLLSSPSPSSPFSIFFSFPLVYLSLPFLSFSPCGIVTLGSSVTNLFCHGEPRRPIQRAMGTSLPTAPKSQLQLVFDICFFASLFLYLSQNRCVIILPWHFLNLREPRQPANII